MIDVSVAKLTGKILHTVQLQCGDERETYLHKCPHGCPCALHRYLHKPKSIGGVKIHWHNSSKGWTRTGGEGRERDNKIELTNKKLRGYVYSY